MVINGFLKYLDLYYALTAVAHIGIDPEKGNDVLDNS